MSIDWVEWASFGAAAAAVLVAFYAVWAGYRNQLRVADRERRRENYAVYLVGISNLRDDLEELDRTIHQFIETAKGAPRTTKDEPAKPLSPDVLKQIVDHVNLWVESALGGVPIDSEKLVEEMSPYGMPPGSKLVFESFTNSMLRLSKHGTSVRLASKILKLSGTPYDVLAAVKTLSDQIVEEFMKATEQRPQPRSWQQFDQKIDALEKLMESDIGL